MAAQSRPGRRRWRISRALSPNSAPATGFLPRAPAPPGDYAKACAQEPWYLAGTDRFCTEIMRLLGTRAYVKTGAEGVFCGALPQQGLGIAIKCDDGAGRAAEAVMAALLARLLPLADQERATLMRFTLPVLRNWNGIEVGALRVTEAIRAPARRQRTRLPPIDNCA
jgi:L-asparaginase II